MYHKLIQKNSNPQNHDIHLQLFDIQNVLLLFIS